VAIRGLGFQEESVDFGTMVCDKDGCSDKSRVEIELIFPCGSDIGAGNKVPPRPRPILAYLNEDIFIYLK
jgi:hypothetical protein